MNGKQWTTEEVDALCASYPNTLTRTIAERLGRTERQVYSKAMSMGLGKSPEFLHELGGRIRAGGSIGVAHRFPKGQVPHNKGLRRPGWAPGRMAQTQFRKGNKPQTWRPVGSERLSKDGYLQRKVTDTGYVPRDWIAVHNLLWIATNGPIPKGHAVVFVNGDKTDIRIDNLQLLTRAELMRRNSVHNLPKELALVCQLKGALTRQINKRAAR